MSEVTQVLMALEEGDPHAAGRLLPLIYDELRMLAARKLQQETPGQTLQATALVHEAYLRLVGDTTAHWDSVRHFYAAAAEAMRRILIENARHKRSIKGGGERKRVDLDEGDVGFQASPHDLIDLDQAVARLERDDQAAADLAKLRLFAGLTVDESAARLGMSRATGFRHWTYARAFLQAELSRA
jgi:RNA polymerase sigma factor (TIGR02999 family)